MRTAVIGVLAICLIAAFAVAGESKPQYDGKVVTVSVFKNGYGFFRMEGGANVKDGRVELSPVPAATLGTWWFYTRKEGVTISQAVAGQRTTEQPRAAMSLEELVSANVGKQAKIETEKGSYVGTILPNSATTSRPPAGPRYDEYGNPPQATPQNAFGGVIMLSSEGAVVALRPGDVKSIAIQGGAADYSEKKKEGYVTLFMNGAQDGSIPVGCQFLEKGIRWIPSYRVELVDDKTAAMTLQGEVINDIHDLDGSTLQLVVGVPNFMSGELLSPLAYVSEMPKLSQFFVPPTSGGGGGGRAGAGYFSNIGMAQLAEARSDMAYAPPAPSNFAVAPTITGGGVSDLYYYTKENVNLKAGERASLNILSANVPYRDIYKWDVANKTNRNRDDEEFLRRYRNGEFSYPGNWTPEVAARVADLTRQDAAEHFIRLTNSTDKPLTSGPALLFLKGSVLSQDVLSYAPAGGTVDVRITGAPDIKVAQKEQETNRNRNALNSYGISFDFVTANVTLTVKNFKKEVVHMVVTKSFDGAIMAAPKDATVTTDTSNLVAVNPHSRAEWEFDLGPGTEQELSFAYSTYVSER